RPPTLAPFPYTTLFRSDTESETVSGATQTGRKRRGPSSPLRCSTGATVRSPHRSIDFVRAAAGASGGGLRAAVAVGAVVREGQRRLHLELTLEPRAALPPSLLVFELVLVQRRRLLDAVRVTELDGEL